MNSITKTALGLVVASLLALLGIASTATESSATGVTPIWVGSPTNGYWGSRSGDASTLPQYHHTFVKAAPRNDFGFDLPLQSRTDRGAYLYVAPSNTAYNNRVTTKITQIIDDNACRYGGGNDLVTVGIYLDGQSYGQVTFGHLDRNPSLWVGQSVPRWNTWLGDVSLNVSGGSNCMTGPHMHMELRATHDYACWNRTFGLGQAVYRTNFVGFVSGPLGRSPQGCP